MVTPNTTYPSAGIFESHGSALTDEPTLTLRSLDGAYTRLDFQDSSSSRVAFIDTVGGVLRIAGTATPTTGDAVLTLNGTNLGFTSTSYTNDVDSGGTGSLKAVGSSRFTWSAGGASMLAPVSGVAGIIYDSTYRILVNSTGIGFFNTTPVAQQGATTDLGVALSNL